MANKEHLAILKQGMDEWNLWRFDNPDIIPDLTDAILTGKDLIGFNLSKARLENIQLDHAVLLGANLQAAKLNRAKLRHADLRDADLSEASLIEVDFFYANLDRAKLQKADLTKAYLWNTNLHEANMAEAILIETEMHRSSFVATNLSNALLQDCSIYGVSIWDVNLTGAVQKNLNISPRGESIITVDNLKVAQFVHLLLNNAEIRNVIDTIGNKAVLILGRFTPDRKAILDALKDSLRERGYVPILFDFERPESRDLTETIITLASLSRFVIADLTNPSSIPHELMSFTEKLPSVAVQPIILKDHFEYALFEHLRRYQWVLPIHKYESQDSLIKELNGKVIQPAEQKATEQKPNNRQQIDDNTR